MYLSEVNELLRDGDLAALSHDGPAELLHLRLLAVTPLSSTRPARRISFSFLRSPPSSLDLYLHAAALEVYFCRPMLFYDHNVHPKSNDRARLNHILSLNDPLFTLAARPGLDKHRLTREPFTVSAHNK